MSCSTCIPSQTGAQMTASEHRSTQRIPLGRPGVTTVMSTQNDHIHQQEEQSVPPAALGILHLFLKSYVRTQETFPSTSVSSALGTVQLRDLASVQKQSIKAIYNPERKQALLCTATKPTTFKSQNPFPSKRTRKKRKAKCSLGSEPTPTAQLCPLHFALRRARTPGFSPGASAAQSDGCPSIGSPGIKEAAIPAAGGEAPARCPRSLARNQFALLSRERKQKHCYTHSANTDI